MRPLGKGRRRNLPAWTGCRWGSGLMPPARTHVGQMVVGAKAEIPAVALVGLWGISPGPRSGPRSDPSRLRGGRLSDPDHRAHCLSVERTLLPRAHGEADRTHASFRHSSANLRHPKSSWVGKSTGSWSEGSGYGNYQQRRNSWAAGWRRPVRNDPEPHSSPPRPAELVSVSILVWS